MLPISRMTGLIYPFRSKMWDLVVGFLIPQTAIYSNGILAINPITIIIGFVGYKPNMGPGQQPLGTLQKNKGAMP